MHHEDLRRAPARLGAARARRRRTSTSCGRWSAGRARYLGRDLPSRPARRSDRPGATAPVSKGDDPVVVTGPVVELVLLGRSAGRRSATSRSTGPTPSSARGDRCVGVRRSVRSRRSQAASVGSGDVRRAASDRQSTLAVERSTAHAETSAGRRECARTRRRLGARRQRTGWPAAASACLTSPIRSVPKWKTVAASTASAPASTAGGKCSTRAGAAGGDHRDRDLAAYGADQLEVEAVLGAVGVHRVEQDLARRRARRPARPTRSRRARRTCRPPWVVTSKPESVPGGPAGVDREHQHLVAEPVGDLGDQLGPVDRGGVDRDLVGAGAQQPVDVLDRGRLPRRRSAG